MTRYAVIGLGKAGRAVAGLLAEQGLLVSAWTRNEATGAAAVAKLPALAPLLQTGGAPAAGEAEVVILAVPDDQLSAVARGAVATNSRPEERVWLHLSGASGYEALGATAGPRGLCHPLQSLRGDAGDREALLGAFFAIDGEGRALDAARSLAERLGGRPEQVPGEARAAYHLAAALAGNAPYATMQAALTVIAAANIDSPALRAGLARLAHGATANMLLAPPAEALTGPFARGDAGTVLRHADRLRATPELLPLYAALGQLWLELAEARGLSDRAIAALSAALAATEEPRREG